MKRLALGLMLAALAVGGPAAAHQYKLGDLSIGHPWSRAAAKGATGVGYLTVTNAGTSPDVLLAVETAAAGRVEIHEGSSASGISRMRRLKGGIVVPAKGKVVLEPGGNHLMLLKLKRPLAIGDKVPATLVFKKAGRVQIILLVQQGAEKTKAKHGH